MFQSLKIFKLKNIHLYTDESLEDHFCSEPMYTWVLNKSDPESLEDHFCSEPMYTWVLNKSDPLATHLYPNSADYTFPQASESLLYHYLSNLIALESLMPILLVCDKIALTSAK